METNEDLDKLLLEIDCEALNYCDDDAFSKELGKSINSSTSDNLNKSASNSKNKPKESSEEKSLVHENDALDSSDEEEMKNFLEQKYNEYGRHLHSNLKKQNEDKIDHRITQDVQRNIRNTIKQNTLPSRKRPFIEYKPCSTTGIRKLENVDIYTDPIFGIRIIHPLISSARFEELMLKRTPIPLSSIRSHVFHGDLSKDWAIAGVIVSKSGINTSKKGSQYVIWTLSDLRGEIKMISLFLFKNAYKQLWKTAQGMVIAILNPGVMNGSEDKPCLSVDNPQKLIILGQSKDLGTCRSRKKNGDMCNAIVNLNSCEYCVYHIKQEYNKMSGRSELQSATSGRGLEALRNKVLGKSEVFYGGQSFLAVPAKKNPKLIAKDKKRLQMLSQQNQSTEALVSKDKKRLLHLFGQELEGTAQVENCNKSYDLKIAAGVDVNASQRLKDLQRLKELKALNEKVTSNNVQKPLQFSDVDKSSMPRKAPTLSQSSFSFDLPAAEKKSNLARAKALQILKKKPIEKSNPNFIKYRGTTHGKKRANEEFTVRDSSDLKKQKLTADAEKFQKERIQKLMEAKSSHADLIVEHANEAQETYFSKQLKKEAMEEKMLNTFEMNCKAVVCLKCRYTAFSSADRCKTEGHPIKIIDAKKRFFQCSDCNNRTTTVHRIPQMCCTKCQGSRWQRSAMIKERIIDRLGELSIRGDEEMFLGSLQGNGNFNLCIAEN